METVPVINEGESQTIRLPKGYHLASATVSVRHEGDAIVLEPIKPRSWPIVFFDEVHISDPAFCRPRQGTLPEIKGL